MNSFDTVWRYLQTHLDSDTTIKNWTVLKGYMGDTFTVVDISRSHINISTPNAQNEQKVPTEDFMKVWEIWHGYKNRNFTRTEMTPLTRYSKYIISIFKWYEVQNG